MTAARSTSTQARWSRPRPDTLTSAGMIPRVGAKCKTMKRLGDCARFPATPASGVAMSGDAALARALTLVRDLRARCPWDRVQTRATLRPYLVEEALELDQALRDGEPAALEDELGDLLLHLAFQIVIGEQRREFDAASVTQALEQKMWRRHPHLFAGAEGPDHAGREPGKRRGRRARAR